MLATIARIKHKSKYVIIELYSKPNLYQNKVKKKKTIVKTRLIRNILIVKLLGIRFGN